MRRYFRNPNFIPTIIIAVAIVAINLLFVQRILGLSYSQFSWINFANNYGPNVTSFTAYINETYVYGYVDTADIPILLRLKDGETIKSEVSTDADGYYFNAYFGSVINGGDVIEIEMPGATTVTFNVAPLTVVANSGNDVVSGTGPPNTELLIWVRSWIYGDFFGYPIIDSSGNYSHDFTTQVDIFMGDRVVELTHDDANGYRTRLRDYYVPGFSVNPESDYIWGYAEAGVEVHLTLKNNSGAVKATATVEASYNGSYSYYFSSSGADIVVGDSVEMVYGSRPVQTVQVANIAVTSIDPVSNIVSGIAPANGKVELWVSDGYTGYGTTAVVTANSSGQFTVDFDTALNLNLVKLENIQDDNEPGGLNQRFGRLGLNIPGSDQITLPEEDNPVAASLDPVPATWPLKMNGAPGHANESGGEFIKQDAPDLIENPSATEEIDSFDIVPGSFAGATYHNAQDNEVSGTSLYAGPYVRVNLDYWNDLFVVGEPNETVSATLRNALGAIKGTVDGNTENNGATYLDFYDTAGNGVDPVSGDQVEVDYQNSTTQIVDVVNIDYVIDRDNRHIYGSGPASSELRIHTNWGDDTYPVMTDASGDYSLYTGRLTGGYGFEAYYRNPQGNDIHIYGYNPQFTVQTTPNSLYGYGPPNSAIVATLKNSAGIVKEINTRTTYGDGWYSMSFSSDISVNDWMEVDAGPLHFEQQIVPLTIDADPDNNIVFGTAPSRAWLNVFDREYYGPYDRYNYWSDYADSAGNFTVPFNEVRAGDDLEVIYWEDGHKDRVTVRRFLQGLYIDHVDDQVYGYSTPGASGTITVRNSSGGIKAVDTVEATSPYGRFSYVPEGVNIIPGDSVQAAIGSLNQTSTVIPLNGTLNVATDSVSGTSLANESIGVEVWHWTGSYYSSWTGNTNLRGFANTNSSGNFSLDYSGVVDITSGDYLGLYFIDDQDAHYDARFFTTSPTVSVDDYPSVVPPSSLVNVLVDLANGAHSSNLYIRWDTSSHADENDYSYWSNWQTGEIGENLVSFVAPTGGRIYFKAYAYIDGQAVWSSSEHTIDISGTAATTLYDPVSGTTNDSTPVFLGATAPNASVSLYRDNVVAGTTTANSAGYFSLNVTTPLAPDTYDFHAIARVNNVPSPRSNTVRLTVNPSLLVDPVHILLETDGVTQHLRDSSGFANLGGRVWTRTGETVGISIPIGYTNVYTAAIYVGGVFDSALLNSGDNVYVGSYSPPSSGTYAVQLKFQGDDAAGDVYSINILTGLIDPDGYVYDSALDADHRIAGATVTAYELVNNEWIFWNAGLWGQSNPQTTGADGHFAFFTLPGTYKVVVTAPGYFEYQSPRLVVVDEPVHHNVPLSTFGYLYLPTIVK